MLIKSRSLEEILNYKTIIFYGIGNQCRECMKLFQDRDIILVDSDNKKWGKNYGKTQIIHGPQIIKDCYEKGKAAIVISALFNQYEIAEFLVNQCAVQEEDLFSYTHGEYEKWVYNPKLIYEHEKDIRICLDMVEDEASKEYYFNSVNARIQRNPLLLKPNANAKRTGEYGDIVRLEKVDYIKMDIEGAEADAIRGSKTLIRENRTKLMISAYHKVSDLWEIPVIIKESCSDYKIYVGHAPGVSTEIEFYCITEDKGMA